jgi:hypothetical protein
MKGAHLELKLNPLVSQVRKDDRIIGHISFDISHLSFVHVAELP